MWTGIRPRPDPARHLRITALGVPEPNKKGAALNCALSLSGQARGAWGMGMAGHRTNAARRERFPVAPGAPRGSCGRLRGCLPRPRNLHSALAFYSPDCLGAQKWSRSLDGSRCTTTFIGVTRWRGFRPSRMPGVYRAPRTHREYPQALRAGW